MRVRYERSHLGQRFLILEGQDWSAGIYGSCHPYVRGFHSPWPKVSRLRYTPMYPGDPIDEHSLVLLWGGLSVVVYVRWRRRRDKQGGS